VSNNQSCSRTSVGNLPGNNVCLTLLGPGHRDGAITPTETTSPHPALVWGTLWGIVSKALLKIAGHKSSLDRFMQVTTPLRSLIVGTAHLLGDRVITAVETGKGHRSHTTQGLLTWL
jgi:hypothetical protein